MDCWPSRVLHQLRKQTMSKRIMPIGDSITRGSYLRTYADGPFAGTPIGLPNEHGGAGVRFEFVGELTYHALDENFDPRHHGLAGFGNRQILTGGVVPTPADVLAALGVSELRVPPLIACLAKHQPDLVLLMSGTNGFDAAGRDDLVETILAHSGAQLLVATIPPQAPPRAGHEQVAAYNASLPATVERLSAAGARIAMVDIHSALKAADLLPDGVHPNDTGMRKIAAAWWSALQPIFEPTFFEQEESNV